MDRIAPPKIAREPTAPARPIVRELADTDIDWTLSPVPVSTPAADVVDQFVDAVLDAGTSIGAVTGAASTRSSAAVSRTRSVRAVGTAASTRIVSASSSATVSLIGRIV